MWCWLRLNVVLASANRKIDPAKLPNQRLTLDIDEFEVAVRSVNDGLYAVQFLSGVLATYRGQFERAQTLLVTAIEAVDINDPDVTLLGLDTAYAFLGFVRNALLDTPGSVAAFSLAIQVNPTFINNYINRGKVQMSTRDWAGAEADFSTVLAAEPDNQDALYQRGEARRRLGRLDEPTGPTR